MIQRKRFITLFNQLYEQEKDSLMFRITTPDIIAETLHEEYKKMWSQNGIEMSPADFISLFLDLGQTAFTTEENLLQFISDGGINDIEIVFLDDEDESPSRVSDNDNL